MFLARIENTKQMIGYETIQIYVNQYIYIYTGGTRVVLAELLTVNMFGFIFFCAPFPHIPHRILAWSFVVPRSNFHPPKAFNLIDLKVGDN